MATRKKDAEWVTGVTPKEGELQTKGVKGFWPGRLLAMKEGEWVKTSNTPNSSQMQYMATRLKQQGKGAWITKRSTDGKWRWIQRVK